MTDLHLASDFAIPTDAVTQTFAILAKRGVGKTYTASVLVEVLIALRTIAPQDREAIDAWIKVHGTPAQREELMRSLPSLPIGTAWFWSPGWLDVFRRVQVRQRETFDSSATPTVGQRPKAPGARAPAPKIEKVVERVEVPVIGDEQLAQIQAAITAIADLGGQLAQIAQDLGVALARATPAWPPSPVGAPLVGAQQPPPQSRPTLARPSVTPECPQNGETPQLRAGERRMLQVLARHYPMKVTRAQLGTLSKFTHTGGTFSAYFGNLKRRGRIAEAGGEVQITKVGMDFLGANVPARPQTTDELLELWRGALRSGERKMLDELVAVYPGTLSRAELGERAGYTASGGTFGAYLGMLRRNGLIEVDGDAVRASAALFLSEGHAAT